jgi:hypothetical protein
VGRRGHIVLGGVAFIWFSAWGALCRGGECGSFVGGGAAGWNYLGDFQVDLAR